MKRFEKWNGYGFTLIELMIVIAIIGILAAVAIPNYMSYRNKGYCTTCEADAMNASTAISAWYSDPSNIDLVTPEDLNLTLSGDNKLEITGSPEAITITVTDGIKKCPKGEKYIISIPKAEGDGWQSN